jgi:hypothetical protein
MGSSTSEITSRTLRDTRRGRNPDQAGAGRTLETTALLPARAAPGGQAVVGVVGGPWGGDRTKPEEQPQAKPLAHAPEPALPSPDEGRDALPIARDDERALSDARRNVTGRSEE